MPGGAVALASPESVPGTPEWCGTLLTQLAPTLSTIGQQISDAQASHGDISVDLIPVAQWALGFLGPAGSAIGSALSAICNGSLTVPISTLIGYVQSAIASIPCFADPQIIGLMYLRTLIRSVERIRLGWDLAVWATADINVDLAEVLQLVNYLIHYLCPQEIPAVGEAIECWVRGVIPDDLAACWVQCHGMYWPTAQLVAQSRYERLGARELIQYQRRMGLPQDWIAGKLLQRGQADGEDQVAQLTLYDELPTISDHLHWLQRNVFDDAYVAQYGLLDGFDTRFWPKFGPDLTALGMKEEYAQLHYAAHWIIPSPEQLREFVYRLRPDKPGVGNPFTTDDYTNLLAEQDVGPYFRPLFAETINRIPALGYLRDMFRQGLLTNEQMASYHQDLGYSAEDSDLFVAVDNIQRLRMRASESHGWVPTSIAKAYVSGQLTPEEVNRGMEALGWTLEEASALMERSAADLRYSILVRSQTRAISNVLTTARNAVKLGIMAPDDASKQLQQLGYQPQYADAIMANAVTDGQIALTGKTISAIRSAYLAGKLNGGQAANALIQTGILPDRTAGYLSEWGLTLTDRRKHLSTSRIVKGVANGEIATADALVRLGNLGYDSADSMLFLADANRQILSAEAKMLSAEEKLAAKRAGEIQKAAKEALAAHKAAVAALRTEAPRATLGKWLKSGIIDRAEFADRMSLLGYSEGDIVRYAEQYSPTG